jgi:hypothetical protein
MDERIEDRRSPVSETVKRGEGESDVMHNNEEASLPPLTTRGTDTLSTLRRR